MGGRVGEEGGKEKGSGEQRCECGDLYAPRVVSILPRAGLGPWLGMGASAGGRAGQDGIPKCQASSLRFFFFFLTSLLEYNCFTMVC